MTSKSTKSLKKEVQLLETVREAHVAVDIETLGKPIQNFSCRELPLGRLELFDICIDPVSIHRRTEDIDKDSNDDFLLATQVEGTVVVKERDVEFIQHPGSLAIMSAAEPYTVIHTQRSHRLILHIPKEVYQERILAHQKLREFRPRLQPMGGVATIVHEILKSLAFEAERLSANEQYTLAECLLELTSTMLRSDVDLEHERHHAKQSALFRRILEFMEANYTDSELSPEKIAIANGISVRYLHGLFRQAGLAVAKWMWERRVKATREDLLDPAMNHMRVSEIAYLRGFNDPAHFSRAFKARFNISPGRMRQMAMEDAESSD